MRWLGAAWIVFVAAVYCPDVGRGFIKDDFTWIRAAKSAAAEPITLIRQRDAGFYRPAVTLSFALDYGAHGWKPRGYGWTNLALYVFCALAVALLAQALGLSPPIAVLAAFLWTANPHGVNMAIVWMSGRTATLLTLFSVLAAAAFLRRWYGSAALLLACALLSKEEAVALPFILLVWAWIRDRGERPRWTAFASLALPLIAYGILRAMTPAMTPATAPSFYRLSADPLLVMRNVGEYLDRSATLTAAALVLAVIAYRATPRIDAGDRRLLLMMGVWWLGMFAITIWLPVRSSLYAVCPSVAAAIAGAVLIERMRAAAARPRLPLEIVLAGLLVASIPLYQRRDDLRAEAARVSQRTLSAIESDLPALPQVGIVVLHEDPEGHVFREAFGDLATEALRTRFGREWDTRIDDDTAASGPGGVIADYWIRRGTLSRVQP